MLSQNCTENIGGSEILYKYFRGGGDFVQTIWGLMKPSPMVNQFAKHNLGTTVHVIIWNTDRSN